MTIEINKHDDEEIFDDINKMLKKNMKIDEIINVIHEAVDEVFIENNFPLDSEIVHEIKRRWTNNINTFYKQKLEKLEKREL